MRYGQAAFVCGHTGGGYSLATDLLSFFHEACSSGASRTGYGHTQFAGASPKDGGLFCGGLSGFSGLPTTEVDKFLFDVGGASVLSVQLSAAATDMAGTASSTAGYFSGGVDTSNVKQTATNKVVYSTEAVSYATGAALSVAKTTVCGLSAPSYGYLCGGYNNTPTTVSTIERIAFSNDTISTLGGTMSLARRQAAGVQYENAGFQCSGGDNSNVQSGISMLAYANETSSTLTYGLATARTWAAGANSPYKGYIAGGYDNLSSTTADIESLIFSTQTIGNPSANLIEPRGGAAGMSNMPAGAPFVGYSTESVSAGHAQDTTGSQGASRTESTTASASQNSIAIMLVDCANPASGTDTTTVLLVIALSKSEPSPVSEEQIAAAAFAPSSSEPGSADDSKTAVMQAV